MFRVPWHVEDLHHQIYPRTHSGRILRHLPENYHRQPQKRLFFVKRAEKILFYILKMTISVKKLL